MAKDIRQKLLDLDIGEEKVDEFLKDTETRNRSIESEGMIRREGEAEEVLEEEVVEEEAEEVVEDNDGEDVEVVLEPEDIDAIFELIQPRIEEMLETVRAAGQEAVDAANETITKLQARIVSLEKEDGEKVREAVEDLPETRKKRKLTLRPSQQRISDQATGEKVEEVDIKAQFDKMTQARKDRKSGNQFD
jgi:hypothetical protein